MVSMYVHPVRHFFSFSGQRRKLTQVPTGESWPFTAFEPAYSNGIAEPEAILSPSASKNPDIDLQGG
jgi:hypothetical protein